MGPTPGAFLNLFKELCESSVIAQTYMQMSDGNLNANDLFILVMLQFLDRFSLCSPTPPLQVLSLGRGGLNALVLIILFQVTWLSTILWEAR